MAELKTRPTRKSATKLINAIDKAQKRQDCLQILALMSDISNEKPVVWGDSIIGFGEYHYQQRSGQQASWPISAFSPRKQNIVIYIMPGFSAYQAHLDKLSVTGKRIKHSVSCLYINKLSDIDLDVLRLLITDAANTIKERYSARPSGLQA